MSDLISRQKILATLDNADKFLDEERTVEKYKELLTECIKVLPSAENDGDLISRQKILDRTVNRNSIWNKITDSEGNNLEDILNSIPSAENKGDLISRQAVMECFKKWRPYMATRLCEFEKELTAIPSVENKGEDRPKGHWIYWSGSPFRWECDKCGGLFKTDFNFCPNCGADMRGKT